VIDGPPSPHDDVYSATTNMKRYVILVWVLGILFFCGTSRGAADTNAASSELQALVSKIQDGLQQGKRTEAELAPEIKEFDALLEKYKVDKTDQTAEIALMKALLYIQVLDDSKKGIELVEKMKQDYPETKPGKYADTILENLKAFEEAKRIQSTLVEGATFPDFEEKDLDGKAMSISKLKGKVVLVDFWATWCGPCVMELPNVSKAYEKHHDQGFEVLGISLDQEEQRVKSFIKQKNMPWQQYFDGKFWQNKLAVKYGVQGIPATFLLDGEGKIIGRNLRGEALEQAVAKALEKTNSPAPTS
jgi:peroxiredoxin